VNQAPDWIQALAEACRHASQAAVARKLQVSTASVSLLLRGVYKHSTVHMEAKVRAMLQAETRSCPELGDITMGRCFEEQAAPFFPSPIRTALYRACRNCIHRSAISKEAAS
jgi:hypothetical protein